MPLLEDIQLKQAELVRKITTAALMVAPMEAALPTTLTTYTAGPPPVIDLAPLPVGPPTYQDAGMVEKDGGFSFGNEWDMSETMALGFSDPVRRDILRNTTTLGFTALETKKLTQAMFYNVDLSGVAPATNTGEVAFNKPLSPASRYYRAYLIGQDGVGAQTIWMAVMFPRAMISETGEQTGNEETEYGYPMTLTATPDTDAGYAVRYMFGGPGWQSQLTAMGY
jgi:hypothetical protein